MTNVNILIHIAIMFAAPFAAAVVNKNMGIPFPIVVVIMWGYALTWMWRNIDVSI